MVVTRPTIAITELKRALKKRTGRLCFDCLVNPNCVNKHSIKFCQKPEWPYLEYEDQRIMIKLKRLKQRTTIHRLRECRRANTDKTPLAMNNMTPMTISLRTALYAPLLTSRSPAKK
mmetsp:Transcript_110723/g.174982  ORF Transcript_110723/g.174982 Transcript_110723/m.174982 type:complete len:117 (-) Transcript_110723:553-903(-)